MPEKSRSSLASSLLINQFIFFAFPLAQGVGAEILSTGDHYFNSDIFTSSVAFLSVLFCLVGAVGDYRALKEKGYSVNFVSTELYDAGGWDLEAAICSMLFGLIALNLSDMNGLRTMIGGDGGRLFQMNFASRMILGGATIAVVNHFIVKGKTIWIENMMSGLVGKIFPNSMERDDLASIDPVEHRSCQRRQQIAQNASDLALEFTSRNFGI